MPLELAGLKYLIGFKFLICCRGRRVLVKTTRKIAAGKNESGETMLADFYEIIKQPKICLGLDSIFSANDTAGMHQYLIKAFKVNFNLHKMEVTIYLASNEKIDEFKYGDLMKSVLNQQIILANKKNRKLT